MKRTVCFILTVCTIFHAGIGQKFDSEKLDRFFDLLEANDKFMGSVAVSRDGEIIYTRSVGYADIENDVKATEASRYRIGSITKTFTSVLVMKAVEEDRLELDRAIDRYFPGIENAGEITIEHLLRHRSGIHNFTNDVEYLTWNTVPKTKEEMVEIIADAGSDFEPGSQAAYSNSNFVLLTYILEEVYDKSYADLLEKYIIEPVGLENTYMGSTRNPAENECRSYSFMESWNLVPETDMSIPAGAGGIVSTPTDLVRFSDALFGGRLLQPESLETMKSVEDQFGIGMVKIPFYKRTGYGHGGGIDGFSSIFSHFPDGSVSYALTSNGTNFNNNNISIAVLSAAYGKSFDLPEFSTYSVSPGELDKYTGVYSSPDLPLEITVTRDENNLIPQGTGQPPIPLEATAEDTFAFDPAGIVMVFDPKNHTMVLNQGDGTFNFTKN